MRWQAEGVGAGEAVDGGRTQLVAGFRAEVATIGNAAAIRVPHVAAGLRGDAVPADLGLKRRLRALKEITLMHTTQHLHRPCFCFSVLVF